jgi:hypothetical protein
MNEEQAQRLATILWKQLPTKMLATLDELAAIEHFRFLTENMEFPISNLVTNKLHDMWFELVSKK